MSNIANLFLLKIFNLYCNSKIKVLMFCSLTTDKPRVHYYVKYCHKQCLTSKNYWEFMFSILTSCFFLIDHLSVFWTISFKIKKIRSDWKSGFLQICVTFEFKWDAQKLNIENIWEKTNCVLKYLGVSINSKDSKAVSTTFKVLRELKRYDMSKMSKHCC